MAKKSMIQREIKRKRLVNRFINKRTVVKKELKKMMSSTDVNLYNETQELRLQRFPRNSLPIRIKIVVGKLGEVEATIVILFVASRST